MDRADKSASRVDSGGEVDFSQYDPIDNPYRCGVADGRDMAAPVKDSREEFERKKTRVTVGWVLIASAVPVAFGVLLLGSTDMMGLVYIPLGILILFSLVGALLVYK